MLLEKFTYFLLAVWKLSLFEMANERGEHGSINDMKEQSVRVNNYTLSAWKIVQKGHKIKPE